MASESHGPPKRIWALWDGTNHGAGEGMNQQRELLDEQLTNRASCHFSYYADAAATLLAVLDRVMDEPLFCPCCNTAWRHGCEPDCPVAACIEAGLVK